MGSWLQRGVQWLTASGRGARRAKAASSGVPTADRSAASATEVQAVPLPGAPTALVGALKPTVPLPVSPAPAAPVSGELQGVVLEIGQPVFTKTPQLVVAGMPAGVHTFTLEVTDNLGASSGPVTIQVRVNPAASEQSGPG